MATNEVIITGNAGGDCQLRFSEAGTGVAGFSLGHNTAPGSQAETLWLPVVIFGDLAVELTPRIAKGEYLKVYGALRARKWTDKETGEQRERVELVANYVHVFPRRDPSENQPSGQTPARHGQRYNDRRDANRRGNGEGQ